MPQTRSLDKLSIERQERYEFARHGWAGFNDEALIDVEMYLGAQNTRKDENFAALTGRPLYVINKMKRQVSLLAGYEIRNRHILKMAPIGGEDSEVARQHTSLITQQMSIFGGYNTMSNCFKMGPLVSGSNLMEIYRDRDGFFRYSRMGHNQFLLDPALRFTDLSDCTFYLTGRYLHNDVVKRLLPQDADEIDKIPVGVGAHRWDHTHNHHYARRHKMRLYEEYWRRKTEFVDTVVSRLTLEEIPYKELVKRHGDKKRVDFLIENGKLPNGLPALSRFQKPINKVHMTAFVDDEVVWDGENPLKLDDYNVVWFPGEWVPEMDRDELKLQAFVRILRDPQKAKNRRISQVHDLVESQLTTYKVVREGALKDPDDAWKTGQGKVLIVKSGFEGTLADAFYQGVTPDIPQGFFRLLAEVDKQETEVGGMNEEIFGSDTKNIPAILSRQRTGAALTGHQGIFEGYRHSKQQVGRKMARLNQIWQDPIRVQRMINERPVRGFYDEDMLFYDCLPTEGLLTDSQQQTNFNELKEIRQLFPDAAQVVTVSDLIESSNLQQKKKLMDRIKQREQQAQQALAQQQKEQQQMSQLVQAETAAKVARAREDTSDIAENRASIQLKNAQTATEVLNLRNEQMMDLAERVAKVELMQAQAEAARRGSGGGKPKRAKKPRRRRLQKA